MSILPVNKSSASTPNTVDLVLDVPSGVQDGDLMLVFLSSRGGSGSFTAPAGWEIIRQEGYSTRNCVCAAVRTALSEPASYTWQYSLGATYGYSAICSAYRNTSGPNVQLNGSYVIWDGGATTISTPAANSYIDDDFMVVAFSHNGDTSGFTPPAEMDLVESSYNGNGTYPYSQHVCHEELVNAGAYSSRVADLGGSKAYRGYIVILIHYSEVNRVFSAPAVSEDDGYWNGSINKTGLFVIFGEPAAGVRHTYLRFPNITIPPRVIIKKSIIIFNSYSDKSGTSCNLFIDTVNNSNPPAPVLLDDCNGWTYNTGQVLWNNVEAWTAERGYVSPDFKDSMQAVVNKSGWASGNACIVTFRDNASSALSERYPSAYDNQPPLSPNLVVDYSPSKPFRRPMLGVGI